MDTTDNHLIKILEKVAYDLGACLPEEAKKVLGDLGYDDPGWRSKIERYHNHLLERCLIVPIQVKKNGSLVISRGPPQ